MKTTYSEATDYGRRHHNEDWYASRPEQGLYLVADGMGGHSSGEYASRLICETVTTVMANPAPLGLRQGQLEDAIHKANKALIAACNTEMSLRGMGTTIAALAFEGDQAIIAHVGDSRVYLLRDGSLMQLTRDHSLLNEYKELQDLTPEQLEALPKNILTRAIGMREELQVSMQTLQAKPGDIFLLCSDGLTEQLDHERLELLMQHPHDELAKSLVQAAVEAGASDNITAIVARCT